MDYSTLDKTDFDAAVTGELTHRALHFEHTLSSLITDFFVTNAARRNEFNRVILLREGLGFQAKIEIVRALLPIFGSAAKQLNLASILKRIEAFKTFRNAMAHGTDVGDEKQPLNLRIEIVTRSGKEKVVEITPESHAKRLADADALLNELDEVLRQLGKFSEKLK